MNSTPQPIGMNTMFSNSLDIYKAAFKRIFIIGFILSVINQFVSDYASSSIALSPHGPMIAWHGP